MTDKKRSKTPKDSNPRRLRFSRMPFVGDAMPDGRRFVSMRVKFVGVMLVTGMTVLALALLLIPLSLRLFRWHYAQPDRVDQRLEEYVRDFAAYVAEEDIRSDDAAAVVAWTKRNRSVYLTVFNDADNHFGAAGGELWEGEDQPDMKPFFNEIISEEYGATVDENGGVYAVRFSNGIHSVAVVDYSLSTGTDIILIIGVLSSILIFFLVLMIYYHSQTRAIVNLSRKVETVSGGNLQAELSSQRNDEIGQLADSVNTMRNTILEKMEERQQAWQANSDLLTSMTHDIRTPLTTLLGYMELLSADSDSLTEEQKSYIRVCTTKAEQIKGLSDKLFLYFWAFNRVEPDSELENVEASLLFEQLIADYIPAMETEGLTVTADLSAIAPTDTVRIRVDSLRRVTDNIFDNLVKYADRRTPVTVVAQREGNELILRFTNAIGQRNDKTSSTRIGVKTCVNMMQMMGGRFETTAEEGRFTATMTLPLVPTR